MTIQFRDRVKVTEGFYEGCEGEVISEERIGTNIYFYKVYINVLINNNEWIRETIKISENYLKIIKKASKGHNEK